MFGYLNPHSSDFGDICALYSPFLHQLTMQSSLFEPGRPVSVVVCVAYKLRPCPSYSRLRYRINLGLWRSLYKSRGGYRFWRSLGEHMGFGSWLVPHGFSIHKDVSVLDPTHSRPSVPCAIWVVKRDFPQGESPLFTGPFVCVLLLALWFCCSVVVILHQFVPA